MSQEQGIIDAKKEFPLTCYFRGLKPTNVRKVVRLEVTHSLHEARLFRFAFEVCVL